MRDLLAILICEEKNIWAEVGWGGVIRVLEDSKRKLETQKLRSALPFCPQRDLETSFYFHIDK